MARPSSKKVMRAAQTGGGRTNRGGQSWAYWALLVVVALAGTIGVLYSRDERRDEIASSASLVPPLANKDHWHAAYGIFVCDKFAPTITDQRDPEGIHTHGDGVIHVHPFLRRAAGKNATLEKFFDAVRAEISDSHIELPDGTTIREGKHKCGGKDGELVIRLKGQDKLRTSDLAGLTFSDRMVLTIAYMPKGTDAADIPLPPSEPNLDNLSDVGPQTTGSTIIAGEGGSSTTAPGDASATTAPATDTTSAPATTSG
jgi:hypothetical protein